MLWKVLSLDTRGKTKEGKKHEQLLRDNSYKKGFLGGKTKIFRSGQHCTSTDTCKYSYITKNYNTKSEMIVVCVNYNKENEFVE